MPTSSCSRPSTFLQQMTSGLNERPARHAVTRQANNFPPSRTASNCEARRGGHESRWPREAFEASLPCRPAITLLFFLIFLALALLPQHTHAALYPPMPCTQTSPLNEAKGASHCLLSILLFFPNERGTAIVYEKPYRTDKCRRRQRRRRKRRRRR